MTKKQKEVLQRQLNSEKEILKDLKKVYEQALADCEKKIRELSARRDMENLQSIIYQKRYQKAIRQQLEGILTALQSDSYSTVSEYLSECYQNGYIGTMYDLHAQGIPLTIPIDQKSVVKAVETDSKISRGLYTRLGEDVDKLKTSIRMEVSRGVASGASWLEVAEKLAKSFKTTDFSKAYNNAARIARTEGHRVQNEAALNGVHDAKEKGADIVKQWDSTLDGRTRDEHRECDGQIREIDEPFDVGGEKMQAPGVGGSARNVCNCRCCLLQRAKWALDDDELNILKERAEFFGLDKTKDFEEFKEKYLEAAEQHEDRKKKPTKNKADAANILTQEETIEKAKKYGQELLDDVSVLKYDNGDPITDYLNFKLKYDVLPSVISDAEFENEKAKKQVWYRGVASTSNMSAKDMAEAFKYGKLYAGRGVYGYGIYADKDRKVAELYAGEDDSGRIIEMLLTDDAKTVDFVEIFTEYEKTGIPKIVGNKPEVYQDILGNVGAYAAVKGYDAILLNGFQNKQHVVILNRGKVIVKE